MGIVGKRSCVTGKHQESRQILVMENAMYVFNIHAHQIILTADNERIDFSIC